MPKNNCSYYQYDGCQSNCMKVKSLAEACLVCGATIQPVIPISVVGLENMFLAVPIWHDQQLDKDKDNTLKEWSKGTYFRHLRTTIITFIVTPQLLKSDKRILAMFHSYLLLHFHSAFWGKYRSQNLDENSTTSNSTPKIHFPFSCFWLRIEIFGRFVLTFGVWLNFLADFLKL